MSASIVVRSARIAAWLHLIHCNLWLQHSFPIPDNVKKGLMDGPISLDGLFGYDLHSILEQMQHSSEEAEKYQKHMSSQPGVRAQRSSAVP
ncbi:Hypothetical protein SMAX5B_011281 [Scophthalmus maximus]|uniref:Uncharacterized protein n=1 Tax=Scophthalmus maximus TaxID=52904 RepID=A0A2U9CKJ5_SCOMX|nr:Hypothetical protein SMAX5B_011281 [Scophthalmus maximus]